MKNKRLLRWGYVLALVTLIYSTLAIVRPVCDFLRNHTPFSLLINLVIFSFIISCFCYLAWILRKGPKNLIGILFVFITIYAGILITIKIPEEKIHFLEYSLLAYLIYRALRLDLKNGRLYLTTIILSGIVGWGDEGIQHLLPNRYYDLRDVTFNFLGAVLGCFLLFVWDKSKRILNH